MGTATMLTPSTKKMSQLFDFYGCINKEKLCRESMRAKLKDKFEFNQISNRALNDTEEISWVIIIEEENKQHSAQRPLVNSRMADLSCV